MRVREVLLGRLPLGVSGWGADSLLRCEKRKEDKNIIFFG